MNRQDIAASILGAIEWDGQDLGYCNCPGESMHTHGTEKRHCRVTLNGVPTVFCFHTSCLSMVEKVNHDLRSAIARAENGGTYKPAKHRMTPEELLALQKKRDIERLRERASRSLNSILRDFSMEPCDMMSLSPVPMNEDPKDDWRRLLMLFKPDDVVWIGDKFSSCNDGADDAKKSHCRQFFRPVKNWLQMEKAPAQFTCPCTFQPGTYSRSNANVVCRRFLVVESDVLTKPQMLAVINWCRQFMRLRAIVDTAGKSLHGWFDNPSPELEAELRVILPNLGRKTDADPRTLDPALFKLSQPCRLPGAIRDGKYQSLYYLDL